MGAPGKCLNPYCSLYDCYERNDKPLCAGEKYNGKNIPKEAKVGIHHNIKETVVKGWTRRLYEDYARHHARDMRTIINDWNTNNLWMFICAQHANAGIAIDSDCQLEQNRIIQKARIASKKTQ